MRAGHRAVLAQAILTLVVACGSDVARACESPRNLPSAPLPRAAAAGRCLPPGVCRAAEAAEVGMWHMVAATTDVLAVHAALLPTGQVVILAGSGNDHNYRSGADGARLFDPASEAIIGAPAFTGAAVPPNDPPSLHDTDVFCSGHSFLPDGRLLVVGGNLEYPTGWVHRTPGVRADMQHGPSFDHPLPYDNPEIARPSCHGFLGLRESFLLDPPSGTWRHGPKMARGRWYPSTLALPDGRVLAMNGYDDVGAAGCLAVGNRTVELFEPATETWSDPLPYPADWPDERYPYVHLLPSGEVFYAGPTAATRRFVPNTLATTGPVMTTTRGARDTGTSILLPLLPEDGYAARVLNVGGAAVFSPYGVPEAELIDLAAPAPAWRALSPMAHGRMHAPSVLLPDGTVLVIGGSAVNEVPGQGVLEAERFDPTSESWSSAGVAALERHYHSVAVLLPDGRVWVAGSNPNRDATGAADPYDLVEPGCPNFGQPCHGDPHDAHGHHELRMEIYSPPYLFRGPRPEVVAAPDVVTYGAPLPIELAAGTDPGTIARAVLVRPATTTHGRNMDQRTVALVRDPAAAEEGVATFLAPPGPTVAPPGYYLLFVLDALGVPSVARFVRLDLAPCGDPPDVDGDGTRDGCDDADAPLVIRRARINASRPNGLPNGRVSVVAEAPPTASGLRLDGRGGIAVRLRDGATLDVATTLGATRCTPCGASCTRCRSASGDARVVMRATKLGVRVGVTLRGLDVAGPFAAGLTVSLVTGPPLAGAGIDWIGAAEGCVGGATRLACHD